MVWFGLRFGRRGNGVIGVHDMDLKVPVLAWGPSGSVLRCARWVGRVCWLMLALPGEGVPGGGYFMPQLMPKVPKYEKSCKGHVGEVN